VNCSRSVLILTSLLHALHFESNHKGLVNGTAGAVLGFDLICFCLYATHMLLICYS
jgi:hypothetical protein